MYKNKTLELTREETGKSGRGASLWKRVWGIFFKRKKWGEQFPRLAGVKEPQVLTKKNKRTEYAEFLCGSLLYSCLSNSSVAEM